MPMSVSGGPTANVGKSDAHGVFGNNWFGGISFGGSAAVPPSSFFSNGGSGGMNNTDWYVLGAVALAGIAALVILKKKG